MAMLSKIIDEAGRYFLKINSDGAALVTLSGSKMELRGKAVDRPSADTVTIGATYWSVDTDPHGYAIEVSDGTSWAVI